MKIQNLKCNAHKNISQIDDENPVFSWQLCGEQNGEKQSAYEIIVEKEDASETRSIVWETGKVVSEQNLHIAYSGIALEPDTKYIWKARAWDEQGNSTSWSAESVIEIGFMQKGWIAKWIGYSRVSDISLDDKRPFYCADDFEKGENQYDLPPVAYMRKEFRLEQEVKRARLYISALGLTEPRLNGKKVGDDLFVPGFSYYHKEVYYRAYDVTKFLRERNVLGLILADGWYSGYIGLNGRGWYGKQPWAIAQLEITYADNTKTTIITDESWKANYGAIIEADILQGETYDAGRELKEWDTYSYNDKEWESVVTNLDNALKPIAHTGVSIVVHNKLEPAQVAYNTPDRAIIKFERCVAGVLKIRVKGKRGNKVLIRHAESLNHEGELHLRGNRSARCQDTYILKGGEEESYQPLFTYHGFQYAEIIGLQNTELLSVEAVEIGSELLEPTKFWCSSEVVNDIYHMIKNTQRNNQFEIPTDCCARDERLGWGLEGNHFLYAMSYLNNQEAFIRKWIRDIWNGQREDGGLEAIAPPVIMKDIEQFVGDLQSNHGIHMIYTLYKIYGDTSMIEEYFEPMTKYFEFMERNSDRNIRFATAGDWLGILEDTNHTDTSHGYGECSPAMIGTSHYALVTKMMESMMEAIGKDEEKNKYHTLYENIRKAYQQNFIERKGTIRRGKQGEYLMALACDFFPDIIADQGKADFAEMLTKEGYVQWKGGTSTTPYFLPTLNKIGRNDLANKFLVSEKYPGIGFMKLKGATTIWERWDGIYENGEHHPHPMNALSHIGYCVVGEYLITGILGIDALKPGFKRILIKPAVSSEITGAKGTYESCYGAIHVEWKTDQGSMHLSCRIPANTSAQIIMPGLDLNGFAMIQGEAEEISFYKGNVKIEILSGVYEMISSI